MDLSKRKLGIGGSDVAAILGIKAFKTAVEIWEDKINPEVEEIVLRPDDHTAPMYWGKVFEKPIIDTYRLTEMNDVTDGETLDQFHHPDCPWLIANIDGISHTKDHGEIILEAKFCTFDHNDEWGESGTDEIPVKHMCQVQHYMHVLDMPMAHVCAKIEYEFKVYEVKRDQEYYANKILPKLKHFWFENVLKKVAPEPSKLKDVKIVYKESNDSEKEATEEQMIAIAQVRLLNGEISDLKEKLEKEKVCIASYMGECGKLVAGNQKIATFNTDKNGRRVFKVSSAK